jgi:hypothetical protein
MTLVALALTLRLVLRPVYTAQPKNEPRPTTPSSWAAQAHTEASKLGIKPTWMARLPLDEMMEDESAGWGFDIRNEDPDTESFHTDVEEDFEAAEPSIEAGSAYWTTSGDDPVLTDQYVQADMVRSAGGWSDVQAEPEDTYSPKWEHADKWSAFRLYIYRAKSARNDFCVSIFDWLRRQTNRERLTTEWRRFQRQNRENFQSCLRRKDWTGLRLTKTQVRALETYYRLCLSRL